MAQQFQDPLVGQVIDDRYEVIARIGEGGMGVVYKVRQVPINRIVAMKMLNQQMAQDPSWVQRFENEAKACSQLQHPNTIRMYDFGQTREGRLFMTMEFLDGQSLREAIAKSAPMHPARVIKILIQCCASLAEAHAAGIIHRDIKPDNVFLISMPGSPDFVKLLDFSVAKLLQETDGMRTQAGIVFGTPQYMSPEQGRGLPLDARSDIYALGILAYEMLTGNVPFDHDNPMAVLQMHQRQPVPALSGSVPPVVQQVVAKALEKEPSKRYQSSGEMMQHCQQVYAQLEGQAGGAPQGRPPLPLSPNEFGPDQKTIVAGQGPMAYGQPQRGPAMGAGYDPAEAKTIIAGQGPRLPGVPGSIRPPVPDHEDDPAEARTIVAGFGAAPMPTARPGQQGAPGGFGQQGAPGGFGQQGAPGGFGQQGAPGGFGQQGAPGGFGQQGAPGGFGQQGAPGGMPPRPPGPGMGNPDDAGPPKTIMIPGSEGVVSFSQQLNAAPAAPADQGRPLSSAAAMETAEDPGLVFWTVCLLSGLAIGVLAYLAVRMFA